MNEDFITLGDGAVKADEGVIVKGSRISVRDHFPIITAEQEEEAFMKAVLYPTVQPAEAGKKWCYVCGDVKGVDEFSPRDNRCKDCEAARKRTDYLKKAARPVRSYTRVKLLTNAGETEYPF